MIYPSKTGTTMWQIQKVSLSTCSSLNNFYIDGSSWILLDSEQGKPRKSEKRYAYKARVTIPGGIKTEITARRSRCCFYVRMIALF